MTRLHFETNNSAEQPEVQTTKKIPGRLLLLLRYCTLTITVVKLVILLLDWQEPGQQRQKKCSDETDALAGAAWGWK